MRQKRLTKKQWDMVLANRAMMWHICYRLHVHPDDVEDVVEDACLPGLIRAAHRFDPTRGVKFSTFAFTVMRGEVLTWRRNSRRRLGKISSMEDDTLLATHEDAKANQDQTLLYDKNECAVLLSRLEKEGRVLMKRRYWDHMTLRELGKVYHVSPQTMRNRITRHFKTMRG